MHGIDPPAFYKTLGNTAQFPPCGLSTAPAAAAPRSPYRHLELCGVALSFPAGSVAAFRHSACFFLPNLAGIPKSPFNIALSPPGC
ncbi:MAG: hypothetical protein WAW66_06685 [Gemmiger qucibialis]